MRHIPIRLSANFPAGPLGLSALQNMPLVQQSHGGGFVVESGPTGKWKTS